MQLTPSAVLRNIVTNQKLWIYCYKKHKHTHSYTSPYDRHTKEEAIFTTKFKKILRNMLNISAKHEANTFKIEWAYTATVLGTMYVIILCLCRWIG